MADVVIRFSREAALELGLLVCKHCGMPPNNHFEWSPKKCAHDPNCPGYEESARRGAIVRRSRVAD